MRTEPEESLGYDNREPKGQAEYAKEQHDLCCKELSLEPRHDREGDTLLESVCALKKDRDEWKEEAELRQKKSDVWEKEVETLRAELKKSDKALEANITTFIDQREQIQEAREIAAAMRRGSIQAEYFQTHPFPWETPASLDSENTKDQLPSGSAASDCSEI